jgi:MAC/Perforin domain
MRSIPSFNYLGRCYDITTTDPLDLTESSKYENALNLSGAKTKSVDTIDGTYDIPDWAEHKSLYRTDYHAETGVVSSTYEFERELKQTVQGTAGTPYGVEFSLSKSVTTFNSQMNSHESSYVYARSLRTTHGLQVNVDDPSGDLELSAKFVKDVSALPVDSLDKVYPHYQGFFKDFGTHFATEVRRSSLSEH